MANEFTMVDTGVFERDSGDTMSANAFYLLLGFCVCWGLALTAVLAHHFAPMDIKMNLLAFLAVGLVVPIIGIVISVKSDNAFISFIGYNLVVVPFGFLLAPVVNQYSPNVVRDAAAITFMITVFMMGAGTFFPRVFENLGGPLFIALSGLVLVRVIQIFVPSMDFGWIDYVAALIFSLYIGFDMYRANNVGKTGDNAVDLSVQIYLDIINLFLMVLKIMGSKKE